MFVAESIYRRDPEAHGRRRFLSQPGEYHRIQGEFFPMKEGKVEHNLVAYATISTVFLLEKK